LTSGGPSTFFRRKIVASACPAPGETLDNPSNKRALPMIALLQTISMLLSIVWWIFLIMIIMSWLINFNVINTRNQFVDSVWRIVNQITEPILRPIRRIIPPVGGLDLSPIIVFVIIFFLQSFIANDLPRMIL
jgi:YggT family protein